MRTEITDAEIQHSPGGVRIIETRRATLRNETLAVKVSLSGLEREDCRKHFANHAGMEPEQAGRHSEELGELCSRLSDHPLGVKLAAQLYRERGGKLEEYLQWLRASGIESLRTGEHFSQDLTKSLELSLGQLTEPQKQLYRVLGVFPAGTLYKAEAIAAASGRARLGERRRIGQAHQKHQSSWTYSQEHATSKSILRIRS